MKNYYEILEVNEKASDEIIEKAYKVLVKRYHPDLNASNKQYAERKIPSAHEISHGKLSWYREEPVLSYVYL